jgi:hypothetical protein
MGKKSLKTPKGGNQNPYIEEEQTTQCQTKKVQKNKQRSTKHTYKTKDRITRTDYYVIQPYTKANTNLIETGYSLLKNDIPNRVMSEVIPSTDLSVSFILTNLERLK